MKLIDVDELKKHIEYFGNEATIDNPLASPVEAVRVKYIDKAPIIDAVEVVRCQNCRHRYAVDWRKSCGEWWCENLDCEVKPEGFCSDGERREDNGKTN